MNSGGILRSVEPLFLLPGGVRNNPDIDLWLSGQIGKALRQEIPLTETLPVR